MGRAAAIMASGTLVSRLLGLVRGALLAGAIGVTTAAADSYDVANKLPNSLYALLAAGVINAALVPAMVRAFRKPDGERTVDRILTLGIVISLGATVVFTLGAQWLVLAYSSGWPPEQVALATAFAYWCVPQLFFYGLYTMFGQVLNAREQFGPYMWAPVVNNVVGIVGLIIYLQMFGGYVVGDPAMEPEAWTSGRIALIGGVATLGIALQALILIWPMVRGGYRWRWRWSGPKGELTIIGKVASWALLAVTLEQVAVLLTTRVASAANAGGGDLSIAGNAAYFYALGLYLVPHSVVTLSLLTVQFTAMSKAAADNNMPRMRFETSRALRVIGVFTVFTTVFMAVNAQYIVRAALPLVTDLEVASVTRILTVLAFALVPLGGMVVFKRAFFALEDAKSVFLMQIPMTAVWVGVAYAGQFTLEPEWWTAGAAAGLAASNYTGLLLRGNVLRKRIGGIDGRRVLSVYARSALAAVVAGAAGWAINLAGTPATELEGIAGGVTSALWLGFVGAVMVTIYVVLALVLRVSEVRELMDSLVKRFRRNVR
jgi:putative peptidoglycan lipid II flippase